MSAKSTSGRDGEFVHPGFHRFVHVIRAESLPEEGAPLGVFETPGCWAAEGMRTGFVSGLISFLNSTG